MSNLPLGVVLSTLVFYALSPATLWNRTDHSSHFFDRAKAANYGRPIDTASNLVGGSEIIINEVDSDTPGTDALEFVELFDGGIGNTPLDGHVVVFYNGGNDASYASFDLDGFATNPSGYFTLGNSAVPGVDRVFTGGSLQNGQDAVALYIGNATDFPNSTPVTTTGILDALVYDNGQADDPGLLVLLNPGQPQVNENGLTTGPTASMQRCTNGFGGSRNTNTYSVFTPTPDESNLCSPTSAPVSLSGRVTNASGQGIRGSVLVLEGGGMTEPRLAVAGTFGYYSFDALSIGTYILTINSKRYTFVVPSRTVTMTDSVNDADFVADPQE